ncbi:MAG TPA: hypothetical protein VLF21_02305 [Candidatus Saccharimonadales bacterium]|nr:hypothetical protein [Candidatus Saccharimonadales bacterium]
MEIRKILASIMVALLAFGPLPMAALADDIDPGSTSPATEQTPPPAADPAPAPATDPAPPADPAPAPSQDPAPQADPASTPTATPTAASSPAAGASSTATTGPSGPTGTVPAYAFDDATSKWVATDKSSFYWSGSLWVSPLYYYVSRTGWYHVLHGSAPAGSVVAPAAINPLLAALLNDPSNINTGPNSTNTALADSHNNALLNFFNNALISNNGSSTATSGNALVDANTHAGDATSGAASVVQNILNLFNAMWSWSTGGLGYFFQNLFGDHTGDITLNPGASAGTGGQLGSYLGSGGGLAANSNTGPGSNNTAGMDSHNNLDVNYQNNGTIDNNLNLLARSGDATVSRNTNGGSASTGDASVDLNILNMINSAIAAGNSFFGLLNIFGNFNGDVLFPNGFINGAIGSSPTGGGDTTVGNSDTGAGSTNNATADSHDNLSLNSGCGAARQASCAFNNNIQTAAQSGNATVSGNTNAGDATTGDASTKSNIFNLFDQSLFGDNAVLVLVNVMGHWMGHIVSLPDTGGSAGGLLTGNATVSNSKTGPGSTNNAGLDSHNTTSINDQSSALINNNINAGALSGNATVANNTNAGGAKSGNARVASNIANIFGSHLSLKKWFGVLVINVFGDWTGSVGEDTAAGNAISSAQSQSASPTTTGGNVVVHTLSNSNNQSTGGGSVGGGSTNSSKASVQILAARTGHVVDTKKATGDTALLLEIAAGVMLLAAGLGALDRRFANARP